MSELLDVLDAFSNPLKIGWVVWLAWGVGQAYWYRYEHTPRVASTSPSVSPPRRPAAAKQEPAAAVVQRLVTPEPVVEPPPVLVEAPSFDPSTAVVETFAATAEELDRFVADFEYDRQSQDPSLKDDPPMFGAEAPQSS